MEKYLQTVLEQIRCKKAHELIRQEMEVHLEEQICDYMAEGMTREEATEAAVKDMGDPVETGVELDRIHRPKIEWQIVISRRNHCDIWTSITIFSVEKCCHNRRIWHG